jgi:RNA polymerase sigma-70 factor (ECF subfamily)
VYAYVAHRVHDRAEAEDITSEVFHEALRSIGRYEWRGAPFITWLFSIAAASIASRWRSSARAQIVAAEDVDEFESLRASAEGAAVETRATLYQLVDSLPPDQRLVLIRRFVDQRSIREIAAELRRSEGAIKQLQFRAIQALKERVAPNTTVQPSPEGTSHEQPERI